MIKKIIFTLQVLIMVLASCNIYADNTKPVMIIRFQNEHIEYERSLQMLIKNALKNQPNLIFKIIANINNQNQSDTKLTAAKASLIKQEMINQGVKEQNIEIDFKEDNQLNYNEIHIYAQ